MASETDDTGVDFQAILALLPTKFQKTLPQIVQVAGLVMGGLGYGYQKIVSMYPDTVGAMSGAPGYMSLSAVAIILCGTAMHRTVNKQATDAAKVAALAPPARKDGTMDALHTFAVGMQQAASSNEPDAIDLANDLMAVIQKHKGTQAQGGGK